MADADVARTCDELLIALYAARVQLEVVAAQSLPYTRVVRVHRNAALRTQQILAAIGYDGAQAEAAPVLVHDESTDEILKLAVESGATGLPIEPPEAAPDDGELDEAEPTSEVPVDDEGDEADVDPTPAAHFQREPVVQEAQADQDPVPATDTSSEAAGSDDEAPTEDIGLVDEPDTLSELSLEDLEEEGSGGPLVSFEDDASESDVEAYEEEEEPSEPELVDFDDPPLVQFDDDEPEGPLVQFDDDEPMVSFDDDDDDDSLVEYDDLIALDDDDEPVAAGTDAASSLVSFDEDDDDDVTQVQAVRDLGIDDEVEIALATAANELRAETADSFDLLPSADDQEATVVQDIDNLEELQRLIQGEEPEPMVIGGDALEELDDDIEVLPVDVSALEDLEEPMIEEFEEEDSESDPSSAAEVIVKGPGRKARRTGPQPITRKAPRTPASVVPTIRDGGSQGIRPAAAAIRLDPEGGASVIGLDDEHEPIEMGSAEDYDPDETRAAAGFSVDVEEYEEYEEIEEIEEIEEFEEVEPAPPAGPTREELDALLARARTALEANDLEGAVTWFSDLIDGDPRTLEGHIGRGRIFLDLGDYARAMSDFIFAAEDIAPGSPEPRVAIGDLFFARKDYRKAIEYFDAAIELAPEHPMAHCRRGISHYYRKNYDQAVRDLQRAEKLDSSIPNIRTYVSMATKKKRR